MTSPLWNVSPQIPIASSDIFQDFIVSFNLIYFISILKSLNASGLISSKNSILLYSPAARAVDVPIESFEPLLADPRTVKERVMSFVSRVMREGRGAYAVVGEYGSGKTQLALFIKNELKRRDIETIYEPTGNPKRIVEVASQAAERALLRTTVVIFDNLDNLRELGRKDVREAVRSLAAVS